MCMQPTEGCSLQAESLRQADLCKDGRCAKAESLWALKRSCGAALPWLVIMAESKDTRDVCGPGRPLSCLLAALVIQVWPV